MIDPRLAAAIADATNTDEPKDPADMNPRELADLIGQGGGRGRRPRKTGASE